MYNEHKFPVFYSGPKTQDSRGLCKIVVKSNLYFHHVCLFGWNISAPNGWIFVEIYLGIFTKFST